MAGWLRERLAAWFVLRDVRKTIGALNRGAPEFEAWVAETLTERLHQNGKLLLEAQVGGSDEIDKVVKSLLARATTNRRRAVTAGASLWSDPAWAVAALEESWVMAFSGALGTKRGRRINQEIEGFQRSALARVR